MRIQQFLQHHGVERNPFAEEDAQSDPVFKEHCINDTYHPGWDKIYGDPREPATSIVFGEKGAGKTAMRLQIERHLDQFSKTHPGERLFVISYDDFNPFLDRFVSRQPSRRRRIDRALTTLKLWDHMDAVLSLGVTQLMNRILKAPRGGDAAEFTAQDLQQLDRSQRRDLLLLAAAYDQSLDEPYRQRWNQLRRKLHFWSAAARVPLIIGCVITAIVLTAGVSVAIAAMTSENAETILQKTPDWWVWAIVIGLGWSPWLWKFATRLFTSVGIKRSLRVINRPINSLRSALMLMKTDELSGQPFPNCDRSDDRFELLTKFQSILKSLGFGGLIVLIDRVDEPHLINGSAELMRDLIWPMLDNKFLKHPGLGVKMMLPAELRYYVEKEDREFSQRARLDKQNMVPSLAWTGEALYDVANARLRACAMEGKSPNISSFFDDSVSHQRLLDGFRSLRVPRHLHKFLYQLLVAHCKAYTDESPQWQIPRERFESELALYERDMIASGV